MQVPLSNTVQFSALGPGATFTIDGVNFMQVTSSTTQNTINQKTGVLSQTDPAYSVTPTSVKLVLDI